MVGVGVHLGDTTGVVGFGESAGDGLGEKGTLDDGVRGDGDAVVWVLLLLLLLSLGLKYCGV